VVAAAVAVIDPDRGSGPPGETLGELLVRTLDEGLQQKRDVEELFAQLERMAGLSPGAADEDDEAAAADDEDLGEDEPGAGGDRYGMRSDDDLDEDDDLDRDDGTSDPTADDDADELPAGGATEGDLLPLVEEYLWETAQDDPATAAPLRAFAELQQNAAVPRQDLEQLESIDVMRFLLHIYLAAPATERATAVRRAFTELGRFCHWAATTQEMAVSKLVDPCQGPLLDQLDRLQAAGLALSSGIRPDRRPGILLVEEVAGNGFGARDDDGDDHWLTVTAAQAALLQRGDLVLAAIAPGPAGDTLVGPVVVLPSDARALME